MYIAYLAPLTQIALLSSVALDNSYSGLPLLVTGSQSVSQSFTAASALPLVIRRHHGVSTSQDTRRTHRRDQANACRSPCKFMAMEFSSLSSIRSDRRKRSARPQRQQSQHTDKRKTSDREQLVADVPDLNSSPSKRGRSGGDVTEKCLVNDVNGESRHAPVADDAANKRRRLKDRPTASNKAEQMPVKLHRSGAAATSSADNERMRSKRKAPFQRRKGRCPSRLFVKSAINHATAPTP